MASLTPRDRVVLMALMAVNEEVSNALLKQRTGLTLEGEARRRVNALDLVASTKRGSAFWHELTDEGWAWCWLEMSQSAPDRSDSGTRSLYTVLEALRRYLEHADLKLSDVFGFQTVRGDELIEAPSNTQLLDAGVSDEPLDTQIRAAYWKLAAEPGDWVSLTQVRQLLGNVAKGDVDEVLRRIECEPDVHLVPETAQLNLTPADRAAAVRIGGQNKHLLRVDRS
jgi:hypothetical protein